MISNIPYKKSNINFNRNFNRLLSFKIIAKHIILIKKIVKYFYEYAYLIIPRSFTPNAMHLALTNSDVGRHGWYAPHCSVFPCSFMLSYATMYQKKGGAAMSDISDVIDSVKEIISEGFQ